MKVPLVCIVILSWNRRTPLVRCLEDLRRLDYPSYSIIIVDNDSRDDSVAQVRERFPEADIVLNGRNLGYAGGANRGIERALQKGAEYVWLLNDDTQIPPSTLSQLIRGSQLEPGIGALSPVIYYQNEPERLQFAGAYVNVQNAVIRSARSVAEANRPEAGEHQVLVGAALLVSAEAIRRVGSFDERYFAYWEDYDLSMRMREAGMSLRVVTEASIFHSETLPAVDGRTRAPYFYYLMTRNEFWFWRRHLGGAIRISRSLLRSFGDALAEAAMCRHRGFTDCADACLDGVWSALRGTPGAYEERRRMPRPLGRLLSWRPFLLRALLRGDWGVVRRWNERPGRG
jgi:GT2 family glycosyltransferase